MNKLHLAILAAAFGASSTLGMFISAAQRPSAIAFADEEHGNKPCINPAGHERGWCKHHGENDEDENEHHGKRHHQRGVSALSGTVLSVSGNIATVRLDSGQVVTVNENGTALTVGQHYTLDGCWQGNVFVLGCYSNGNFPSGNHQEISGTILSVSGNSLILVGIPPVTLDISIALANNRTNGALVPLRYIHAFGYYQNGVFHATTIQ